ncbi:hypothetical protein [Roseateles noduli]|uniref:hypothetical protein n=1 Tax=Roseateles noduli TaxID=2052484 RepID=UPI003D657C31
MKRIERVASVGGKSVVMHGTARLVLTGTMVAVLAACGGGGGGDAGTPVVGPGSGSGSTPTTPVVTAPTMTLKLTSVTVTASAPATVTASLRTATGAPVANTVVTFTTAAGLGKFDSTTALTNDSGDATVTLSPASATTAGADTINATATVAGASITASSGFQLAATNVTIDSLTSDLALSALPPNGETTLTVGLSSTAIGTPVNVSLTSACVVAGKGTLTPTGTVTTTTGSASFRFRDNSCGSFQGTDTYQATIVGSTSTRQLVLTLGTPQAQSLQATDTATKTIYLKGSGYTEFANVTFRLVDAGGNGVPNQPIDLSANVWSGGLTLDGVTGATITKNTDTNGDVVVRINSGTVPTPVRVAATLKNTTISTVSSSLSIAVGLPSQLNFSLAQGSANIEGADRDGTPNTYSIIASDRLGNPVPDGTAINFVSEAGQVVNTVFTAKDTNGISRATSNFAAAEPRPADGRVTVLAYALGEESFIDKNGNNVYDAGEQFQNLGSVFLDRLYNNNYSTTDQFIKQNDSTGTGVCANDPNNVLTEPAKSLFAFGSYTPYVPGTCDAGQGRAYVRRAVETVFSTSKANIVWGLKAPGNLRQAAVNGTCPDTRKLIDFGAFAKGSGVDDNGATANWWGYSEDGRDAPNWVTVSRVGSGNNVLYGGAATMSLYFLVSDNNGTAFNPMPASSKVTATGSDGLTVTVQAGSSTPSTLVPTGATVDVKFADATDSGTVYITVTSPAGLATTFSQAVAKAGPTGTACP